MADPITLAAIGAVGGAALKPSNPLQGAMLGGMAGFTGGTALGVGGATTAAGGGTGLTLGSSGAGLTAGNTATGYGIGGASGVGLTAPAATTGYGLAAPVAASAAMTPSFTERLGMAGKSAYENPMMTAQALNATQGLLTPEQQPPSAPAVPVQKGQLRDYNPMASMDPYKQSVVGGQPISLI
jgi:hypothetical protein